MVKFDFVNKLLNKKNGIVPKNRQVYAVQTGTYVGELFVYCKKDKENYHFLSIPKNVNRSIPIDKFDFATNNKIIEFAHTLPKDIYKVCFKQFEYNEKTKKQQTK